MDVLGLRRLEAAQLRPKMAGCTKKVHGHSLLGLFRGTNAAELLFCSWKVGLEHRARPLGKGEGGKGE